MSDFISRRAAIEALGEEREAIDLALESLTLTYEIRERLHQRRGQNRKDVDIIKELPSAQPERKKGTWELSEIQNEEEISNGNYQYTCSNCGMGDLHAKTQDVPYCWWCGADMRGRQDE